MLVVLGLPSLLAPPKKTAVRPSNPAAANTGRAANTTPAEPTPAAAPAAVRSACPSVHPTAAVPETVWVTSGAYRFGFSPVGAQLVRAELTGYRSFAAGDSGRPVQLIPDGRPLLAHCLIVGADTISLADWRFTPAAPALQVAGDSVPLKIGRAHV